MTDKYRVVNYELAWGREDRYSRLRQEYRLKGFEKVLGRKFECLDCKYHWSNLPYLDPDACICENICEEFQLTDETLVEIKEKMGDADDGGKDIHPRHRLRDLEQRTVIGLQIIKLELIL